jgi:hypothetical protein
MFECRPPRLLDGAGAHVVPYRKSFEGLGSNSVASNFARSALHTRIRRNEEEDDVVVDSGAFTPLSLLMENSILIPLRAQLGVVNSAVVDYLLVEAKLNDHFKVRLN